MSDLQLSTLTWHQDWPERMKFSYRSDRPLANIARGKQAWQSSLSQRSTKGEASRAVSGVLPNSFAFAFHTDIEERPWWQIDLLSIFPLERIVIHNRLDMFQERARSLVVEVSRDNEHWAVVHAGPSDFSGGDKGQPLDVPLLSEVCARYVRLSLTERDYLHLAQVGVFVRAEFFGFIDFRERHGLSNLKLTGDNVSKPWPQLYDIEVNNFQGKNMPIVGLKFSRSGRFGNLLNKYTNAILLAKKTGLKYIQLGRHELCDPIAEITVDGLTFLPANAPLPPGGSFLTGGFFDTAPFAPILSPFLKFLRDDEVEHCRVMREIIRPYLLTGLPRSNGDHFEDEVTIHIRSGDIFRLDRPVDSGMRQPPLSFYMLVINRMIASGAITRVHLVFQDRGNPCIDALEEFLTGKGIAFRTTSGTLADDLSALIDARHLVFGNGTFGYAVCRLSTRIKTLHYFAPELGGSYGFMPGIEQVFAVYDRACGYIKTYQFHADTICPGEWRNAPEQRELMCTYPVEALEIEELKPV